jgi:hypothetical protein
VFKTNSVQMITLTCQLQIVCTIIAAGGKLVDLLQYRDHDLTEAFPDIATITRMTKKADPDLMARLIQQIREERSLEYIQPGAAEMTAMWESLDNCWMQSIGNVEEFGGNRQDEAWGTWATSIENAINGASKCTYATPEGVRRVVFALLHLDDFRGLPFPTPRAVERVMSAVEKCRYGISEVSLIHTLPRHRSSWPATPASSVPPSQELLPSNSWVCVFVPHRSSCPATPVRQSCTHHLTLSFHASDSRSFTFRSAPGLNRLAPFRARVDRTLRFEARLMD